MLDFDIKFGFFFGNNGGGGGNGIYDGGGIGGPDGPLPPTDCPELTTARLADVAAAGNFSLVIGLPHHTRLSFVEDGDRYRVEFASKTIGWLPPDKSAIIKRCMASGYSYTISLESVGIVSSPRIEVRIERS